MSVGAPCDRKVASLAKVMQQGNGIGMDSNFANSPHNCSPTSRDLRPAAAEGGTKDPVALYSELHLLWRRLCTWSLRAWM